MTHEYHRSRFRLLTEAQQREVLFLALIKRDAVEALDEVYQELGHNCPKCGTMVEATALTCPGCDLVFEKPGGERV